MPTNLPAPHVLQIRASAGAGKTYQLTRQYLRLLKGLGSPTPEALRSLVAITFTNVAAAEMKERIISSLKEIILSTPEGKDLSRVTGLSPREAEGWLETILRYYGDLQIRTIDSLVFTILKAVAFELGLRPDLEAELREDQLLARAFDRLLLEAGEGEKELERLFRQVLTTFLELENLGGFNPEGKIRFRLLTLFRQEIRKGPADSPSGSSGLKALEEELCRLGRELTEKVREHGGTFKYPSYGWEKMFQDPLRNLKATPFKKDSLAEVIKAPREVIERLSPLYEAFRQAFDAYLLARAVERLAPYMKLYARVKEELETIRQEEGLIHGGGWLELIKEALSKGWTPHIYCKLGVRLRHFLIDEFQDTSRAQWEALEALIVNCLAEGGSLVYVGDTKQAIYVWRGGDSELFQEVPQSLPADAYRLDLPYNWRSCREIVEFNNRIFSLLAEEEMALWVAKGLLYGTKPPRGLDPYASQLAARIRQTFDGAVQQLPPEAPEGGKIRLYQVKEEEAIRDLLEEMLPSSFEKYGQVALLVRSNKQAERLSTWTFEMRLPTVTENALRLAGSPLIQSLTALLRFLEYPLDNVALAGVLLSGLLPETPAEEVVRDFLVSWQRGRGALEEYKGEGADTNVSLYGYLKNDRFKKDFSGVADRLEAFLGRVGRVSTYDLVRGIFDELDLWQRFPAETAFARRFLELVLRYEEEEGGDVSGFLDFWRQGGGKERLGFPEGLSAVRIMTIHAAKGLEFPAVFLPFPHWKIRFDPLVRLDDGRLGYATSPYSQKIRASLMAAKISQALEALNLLYVALTRAKRELVVFFLSPSKRQGFDIGKVLWRLIKEAGYLIEEI